MSCICRKGKCNAKRSCRDYKSSKRKGSFVAYVHEDNLAEEDILEIIKELQPDGLEAYYLYVDRYDNKFDETKKWNEFAKRHNLFVTVGSDFHNTKKKLKPQIGFVNTDFVLSEKVIEEIISNLEK